jgi:hypothetical protein
VTEKEKEGASSHKGLYIGIPMIVVGVALLLNAGLEIKFSKGIGSAYHGLRGNIRGMTSENKALLAVEEKMAKAVKENDAKAFTEAETEYKKLREAAQKKVDLLESKVAKGGGKVSESLTSKSTFARQSFDDITGRIDKNFAGIIPDAAASDKLVRIETTKYVAVWDPTGSGYGSKYAKEKSFDTTEKRDEWIAKKKKNWVPNSLTEDEFKKAMKSDVAHTTAVMDHAKISEDVLTARKTYITETSLARNKAANTPGNFKKSLIGGGLILAIGTMITAGSTMMGLQCGSFASTVASMEGQLNTQGQTVRDATLALQIFQTNALSTTP